MDKWTIIQPHQQPRCPLLEGICAYLHKLRCLFVPVEVIRNVQLAAVTKSTTKSSLCFTCLHLVNDKCSEKWPEINPKDALTSLPVCLVVTPEAQTAGGSQYVRGKAARQQQMDLECVDELLIEGNNLSLDYMGKKTCCYFNVNEKWSNVDTRSESLKAHSV